mmetsp:Transcript_102/g.379  ORF Transcript_102/g.379 Transcript_102/m.379 type:complete len:137 (-) Transcript_102:1329-1739(-)
MRVRFRFFCVFAGFVIHLLGGGCGPVSLHASLIISFISFVCSQHGILRHESHFTVNLISKSACEMVHLLREFSNHTITFLHTASSTSASAPHHLTSSPTLCHQSTPHSSGACCQKHQHSSISTTIGEWLPNIPQHS